MRSVAIPPLQPVRQELITDEVADPAADLRRALGRPALIEQLEPGAQAVGEPKPGRFDKQGNLKIDSRF